MTKNRFGDQQHGIKEKEGYIFLFNDMLVLAKQKNKDQTLTYKDSISLSGVSLEDLKDDQGSFSFVHFFFTILLYLLINTNIILLLVKNTKNAILVKGNKSILLSAKNAAEKTTWVQKINASIAGKA